MLSFAVFADGKPVHHLDLSGSYLIGSDDVPLRADCSFRQGAITCDKRAAGPAGISLLWDVDGVGTVMLSTVRVPERARPYLLQVELARGRLMRLSQKVEDWGLIDYEGTGPISDRIAASKDLLIRAITADDPAEASRLAQSSLDTSCLAAEELTVFHARVLLDRRMQSGDFGRHTMGAAIPWDRSPADFLSRIDKKLDFVTLSIPWRGVEPEEQKFNWEPWDQWVEALSRAGIPIKGSSLVCFAEDFVPDWLYIWEHDFDTIRDLAFEHAKRVIKRYGNQIKVWDAVSGLHGDNCFSFNFEQLMELTRMAVALVKKSSSSNAAVVNIVAPWGEYYARNQRTIPPLLYADMVQQSGINCDAYGLRFQFGPAIDGMYVRDMFQISSLLDQFSRLGKPVNVSAICVPSDPSGLAGPEGDAGASRKSGGCWHKPWSEETQADWARQFIEIALSKPFVDSVCWDRIVDVAGGPIPTGGLLRSDATPKLSYNTLIKLKARIAGKVRKPRT